MEVQEDGVSGLMTLMNPSQTDASGAADVETLDGDTVVDGASGSYTVPAGMSQTYMWSGPTVPAPGQYQARSRTKIAEALTDKEFHVFLQLAQGRSVAEVADTFHLSPNTVGTHLYHIKQKLGVQNMAELAMAAVRSGLIEV